MLHTVNAPAFDRTEAVAKRRLEQQLRLIAQQRVVELGKELQTLGQMVYRFSIG